MLFLVSLFTDSRRDVLEMTVLAWLEMTVLAWLEMTVLAWLEMTVLAWLMVEVWRKRRSCLRHLKFIDKVLNSKD